MSRINNSTCSIRRLSGCKLIGVDCSLEKKWTRLERERKRRRRRRSPDIIIPIFNIALHFVNIH